MAQLPHECLPASTTKRQGSSDCKSDLHVSEAPSVFINGILVLLSRSCSLQLLTDCSACNIAHAIGTLPSGLVSLPSWNLRAPSSQVCRPPPPRYPPFPAIRLPLPFGILKSTSRQGNATNMHRDAFLATASLFKRGIARILLAAVPNGHWRYQTLFLQTAVQRSCTSMLLPAAGPNSALVPARCQSHTRDQPHP